MRPARRERRLRQACGSLFNIIEHLLHPPRLPCVKNFLRASMAGAFAFCVRILRYFGNRPGADRSAQARPCGAITPITLDYTRLHPKPRGDYPLERTLLRTRPVAKELHVAGQAALEAPGPRRWSERTRFRDAAGFRRPRPRHVNAAKAKAIST